MAERLILALCGFRRALLAFLSSYGVFLIIIGAVVASYCLLNGITVPSYMKLIPLPLLALHGNTGDREEDFGGTGPIVVCYSRVSTSRQARQGNSLAAQEEALALMVAKLHPSYVYWKSDPGKTGLDFTKRKIGEIQKLREGGEVDELWVTDIDRIGRDCEELILFFITFCKNGGTIRTPNAVYTSKDLPSLLGYILQAYVAEQSNRARANAAVAGREKGLKAGKWNKPVPYGYVKNGSWIEKDLKCAKIIPDIYRFFTAHKSLSHVSREIARRYGVELSSPRIRVILCNPIYIGKLKQTDPVAAYPGLACVEERIFNESGEILKKIETEHEVKCHKLMDEIAYENLESLGKFLSQNPPVHNGCGGRIVYNGTRRDLGFSQLTLKCNQPKCSGQWRFPKAPAKEKPKEQSIQPGNDNRPVSVSASKVHQSGQTLISAFNIETIETSSSERTSLPNHPS